MTPDVTPAASSKLARLAAQSNCLQRELNGLCLTEQFQGHDITKLILSRLSPTSLTGPAAQQGGPKQGTIEEMHQKHDAVVQISSVLLKQGSNGEMNQKYDAVIQIGSVLLNEPASIGGSEPNFAGTVEIDLSDDKELDLTEDRPRFSHSSKTKVDRTRSSSSANRASKRYSESPALRTYSQSSKHRGSSLGPASAGSKAPVQRIRSNSTKHHDANAIRASICLRSRSPPPGRHLKPMKSKGSVSRHSLPASKSPFRSSSASSPCPERRRQSMRPTSGRPAQVQGRSTSPIRSSSTSRTSHLRGTAPPEILQTNEASDLITSSFNSLGLSAHSAAASEENNDNSDSSRLCARAERLEEHPNEGVCLIQGPITKLVKTKSKKAKEPRNDEVDEHNDLDSSSEFSSDDVNEGITAFCSAEGQHKS